MIGPTRRMAGYETAGLAWAPKEPPPSPAGTQWPVPALDGAGQPYPPEISEDGPRIVSEFLEKGLKNLDLASGLDRLDRELKDRARASEQFLGVTVFPGDLDWTFPNIDAALTRAARTDPRLPRSVEATVAYHLLRDTLMARLTAKGFALDTPVTPLGLLPNDLFYDPITLRRHMKDVMIDQDHGEWTHMIQWYLLATASDLKTGNRAAEVFEYLGRQGKAQYAEPAGPRQGPNLWRVCCDRDAPYMHRHGSPAASTSDFRNPDMLNLGLAGFGPVRQQRVEQRLRVFDGGPIFAAFTETRDAWIANRRRWPLLSALLRHRALKREPMHQQAATITKALKAEVRARVEAFLPQTDTIVASSDLDRFFLNNFFKTPDDGVVTYHLEHLTLPPGLVLSPAGMGFIHDQLDLIHAEYGKFFYQANPAAIAYGWARLYRMQPDSLDPPPADTATALTEFRNLPPLAQSDLCAFAQAGTRLW